MKTSRMESHNYCPVLNTFAVRWTTSLTPAPNSSFASTSSFRLSCSARSTFSLCAIRVRSSSWKNERELGEWLLNLTGIGDLGVKMFPTPVVSHHIKEGRFYTLSRAHKVYLSPNWLLGMMHVTFGILHSQRRSSGLQWLSHWKMYRTSDTNRMPFENDWSF